MSIELHPSLSPHGAVPERGGGGGLDRRRGSGERRRAGQLGLCVRALHPGAGAGGFASKSITVSSVDEQGLHVKC